MASIVQKFNPRDSEHVAWLKELGEGTDNCDIIYLMNHNPMNEIFTDFMQFADIHFHLAMKYTNAVLSKDAFIP
mgnify:CR=1 FL=1